MADLIRRQDAIEVIEQLLSTPYGTTIVYKGDIVSRKVALDALWKIGEEENQPSAQPEIIICKDCKYYIPYEWMFDGLSRSSNRNDYAPDEIGCAVNDHNYPPEGFCSYAERRTNECTD